MRGKLKHMFLKKVCNVTMWLLIPLMYIVCVRVHGISNQKLFSQDTVTQ